MTNDAKNQFKAYYEVLLALMQSQGIYDPPKFEVLDDFYGEDHRYYHNRNHIVELLHLHEMCYEDIKMTSFEGILVDITIWFHDIIYQPKQINNEQRSADLFKALTPQFANYLNTSLIYETILHTTHFREDSHVLPKWSQYMLDLDLAGFGSPENKFRENTLKLRMENSHVNNETFDMNRLAFLKRLLVRNRPIYHNPYELTFFKTLEKKACANIQREIAELVGRINVYDD